jgi:hypothetical protein
MEREKFMSKSLIFVAFCLLGGCVTSQDQSAQMASLRANIPKCSEQRQCEGMWAAARNWVSRSCGMKIQTMTDNFIETYTSLGTEAACRITKDPEPAGGYSFHVWVSFGNHYMTGAIEMAQNFQSTVNGAGEAFTTARAAR